MELRYLKYFVAVAEEMNFNRAARRLHISQPPLSRQIKILEGEIGTALLQREGKQFHLTEAGKYFMNEAVRILDEVQSLERQTGLIGNSASGFVRIGYIGSIMSSFLPELLAHIKENIPDIRVDILELATEQQADAILSGKIDLGLSRSWADIKGLQFEPLGRESFSVIYPQSMIPPGSKPDAIGYFSSYPFISMSRNTAPGLFERILDTCIRAGFTPDVFYECSQFSSILRLVTAGLGWSIIPTFALKKMYIENIDMIPLAETMEFGLAHKAGPIPARVRKVMDTIKYFIARYE